MLTVRTNWVRERLQAGQAAVGCFLGLGSPAVAELLAQAGFDWLVIETEHNGLDSAEIEHMLMAVKGTNAIPLVRVPSSAPVYIQRALDMGALGIVVPLVRTAAEAEAIVRATRYPPLGTRGYGPLRASQYTFDSEDYYNRANDNILVVLIIETREAVENLDAIAGVVGIDVLYIGPSDLGLSLGLHPLRQPGPEVEGAIEKAMVIGRERGVAVGMHCYSPEELRQRQGQGQRFLGYAPDFALLIRAAREGLAAYQR